MAALRCSKLMLINEHKYIKLKCTKVYYHYQYHHHAKFECIAELWERNEWSSYITLIRDARSTCIHYIYIVKKIKIATYRYTITVSVSQYQYQYHYQNYHCMSVSVSLYHCITINHSMCINTIIHHCTIIY